MPAVGGWPDDSLGNTLLWRMQVVIPFGMMHRVVSSDPSSMRFMVHPHDSINQRRVGTKDSRARRAAFSAGARGEARDARDDARASDHDVLADARATDPRDDARAAGNDVRDDARASDPRRHARASDARAAGSDAHDDARAAGSDPRDDARAAGSDPREDARAAGSDVRDDARANGCARQPC